LRGSLKAPGLGHGLRVNPSLVVLTELEWSSHTCIPKGFMYYRDNFTSTIISLIESYLTLSYVLP